MVECKCYSFSCLACRRQGRRLGRQVRVDTWKGFKETGKGQEASGIDPTGGRQPPEVPFLTRCRSSHVEEVRPTFSQW